MTKTDLRLMYRQQTGQYPILPKDCTNIDDYDAVDIMDYILWLEDALIKHIILKRKFLPWESLENYKITRN